MLEMQLFFELICVSIGERRLLSSVPKKEEWFEIFSECERHAIVGIAFEGIQRLPKEQSPPQEILFQWIAENEQIRLQNLIVNKRSIELIIYLKEKGYRSCVLKGQGNALMYVSPCSRTPGDIDLWVDIEDKEAIKLVREKYSGLHYQYHHVDYPLFKDVIVELHYRPSYFNNIIYNRRFQQYVEREKYRQFENKVELPDNSGIICRPTIDFNCIFQMSHLMHHYFEGGIGLRQFVDYYYLLRSDESFRDKEWTHQFNYFGMLKFARGVMWIEKEVLGIDKMFLLVDPDERIGRDILSQVMEGGSWGQTRKNKLGNGKWSRFYSLMIRNLHLFKDFPLEVISQPFFLVWHQWWKLKMRIKLV